MGGRINLISGGDHTCIEKHLTSECDNINGAAANHGALASRKAPAARPPRAVVPGGLVRGPAAAAIAAVGATEPINVNSLDFRPAPFASHYNAAAPQRKLAE